jgi:hypothetical protein
MVPFCIFASMNLRIFSTFLLFWVISLGIQCQEVLSFTNKQFNYGSVANWENPPATFVFTNESVHPQYVLAPKHSRNVLVEYPKMRLEPGETGEIRVFFYTEKTGNFSEDILIYVSGSPEPIKLNIKGQIKSLAVNALTACPPAHLRTRFERPEVLVKGKVVDEETGKPLAHAKVNFGSLGAVYTNVQGQFQLKLPVGLYQASAQAQTYIPLQRPESITREQPELVFALRRGAERLPEPLPLAKDTMPEESPFFALKTYLPSNVVLLLDVSGSMNRESRMQQVKLATQKLIDMIRSVDYLSLLTFATGVQELFIHQVGNKKAEMQSFVEKLTAGGNTNSLGGLESAYRIAQLGFIEGGNNQVILITDGKFQISSALLDMVRGFLDKGIVLTVVGFENEPAGLNGLNKLAQNGGGGFITLTPKMDVDDVLRESLRQNAKRGVAE